MKIRLRVSDGLQNSTWRIQVVIMPGRHRSNKPFLCVLRLSSHAYQGGGGAPRHASCGAGAMGISNLALYTNGTMEISENNAAHEGGGHIWLCICHVHTTPQAIGQLQRVLRPIAAFSASDRRADWPGGEPRPWAPNR